jgi:uncharacterized protein
MDRAFLTGRRGTARASDRTAAWLSRHTLSVPVAALVVTGLLAIPLLTMAPDEAASQEPEGAVFDARDQLEERFGAGVVGWFFIVEARDGEMLERSSLLALRAREAALIAEGTAPLVSRTDPATGATLEGVGSLAGRVDRALAAHGGLEGADDAMVRATVDDLLDEMGPGELGVSVRARRDEVAGRWSAPAVTVSVFVDAQAIAGHGTDAGFGTDVAIEEAGREVQALLSDTDELHVWGVALDQALTAEEQGQAAGPFIGFTVLAMLLLVGLAFRNYFVLAVVGAALASLLVWLQGLSNLVGLKQDQILSTIVPIAMIAFGIDYAFHALSRYREERGVLLTSEQALRRGLSGVLPALLLALATGVFAFLANTASAIESIAQFGVAAAVALLCAFIVLGLVVPAAVAAIDRHVAGRRPRGAPALALAGGLAAASMAMAAVLFVVYLSAPVGLALLGVYLVLFLALPLLLATRVPNRTPAPTVPSPPAPARELAEWLGALVTAVARRRWIVLPTVAVCTIVAGVYALQVPAAFDVEDFFAQDTDFVVSLDKVDEHIGTQGGEQAIVLARGDLSEPPAQDALSRFAERVADLDTDLLAQDTQGRIRVDTDALEVLTGTSPLTAPEAAQVVAPADGDELMAARLSVGLVGSRSQENVEAARALLAPLVSDLDRELAAQHPDAGATLTGTPIVRQASLDAISRSLQASLPIAALLCLAVLWAFLRSWRYAAITLVPILLVVVWLYAFMYLVGVSVNLVTATIGAISIGVGIDFSTHMTMRYREELARTVSRLEALREAAAGTGTALAGSTASSAAGFAVLAFAPMPMFASFGLLTAVMICLALAATLLVLPSLLLFVDHRADAPELAHSRQSGHHRPCSQPVRMSGSRPLAEPARTPGTPPELPPGRNRP